MVHSIAPDELPRLAPKLKPYLQRPDPTWPELIDAASEWLRHDLGVSKSLWSDACIAMGRELATIALAIVSTKEADYFTTSPGGYFHGMVAKHVAGQLHLERTIWALRRSIDPERYAAKDAAQYSVRSTNHGKRQHARSNPNPPRSEHSDPGLASYQIPIR